MRARPLRRDRRRRPLSAIDHHFTATQTVLALAGAEFGLVPERIGTEDDVAAGSGYGVDQSRPTLRFLGWIRCGETIRGRVSACWGGCHAGGQVVAFVSVTLFRAIFDGVPRPGACSLYDLSSSGRVCVLPDPSAPTRTLQRPDPSRCRGPFRLPSTPDAGCTDSTARCAFGILDIDRYASDRDHRSHRRGGSALSFRSLVRRPDPASTAPTSSSARARDGLRASHHGVDR